MDTNVTYKLWCAGYIETLRVHHEDVFVDIHLKSNEHNNEFVRNKIWPIKDYRDIKVEITPNLKFCNVTLPDNTIHPLSIRKANVCGEREMSRVRMQKEKNKEKEKFLMFLKELGLKFKIEFNQYAEDYDFMIVEFRGQTIFEGTTEDLQ